MLRAKQAYDLGIADAMFEPADFLERSLEWAVGGGQRARSPSSARRSTAARPGTTPRSRPRRARREGARRAPAPYRALDLIELAKHRVFERPAPPPRTRRSADLDHERRAAGGLYAFDLTQKRAKRPVGAPDKSRARGRSPRSASSAPA
jgi:hypothetical protein